MTIKQYGGVFGRNPTFNDVTIEGQLTFDGDIDINSDLKVSGDIETTGNVIIATSGKGIDFSATGTGTGTSTSELFADYEEGTWTAQLAGTSTNPTTPITSTGKYTRVGRQVTVTFDLSGNTTGASGVYIVNGFPYAIGAGSNYYAALVTANMGAVPVAAYGAGGNTYFALVEQTTFNYLPMSAGAGRSVSGTFTYFV